MPYPNSNILNIVIPQTSGSLQAGQAPFVERIISGSNLILQTDSTGTLIGSSDLNMSSITASNITASGYISASNLYVKTNITDGGTLTVLGTSTFSGLISASAGLTASAIQDIGTLTVVGNSTLTNVFATNITASNISASGNISSSNEYISGNLTVVGTTSIGNITITNLTASNVSASNTLSASNVWFGNSMTYTETMATGSLTSPDINFTSTATTGSDVMFSISTTVLTGSAVALLINASGSQASYAISASNGIIAGTNFITTNITSSNISASGQIIASSFTGSLSGTSSWANVSVSSSVGVINDNSTYYVTFVNNTGSTALKADADVLSYNPLLNRVTIGNTSGSLLISTDGGSNLNYISLQSDNAGALLQVGSPASNDTASLYVGKNSNGFRVLTGQGIGNGVYTELITSIINTTNATSYTDTNAALRVDGGVRISKDTWISGSLNIAGDFTVFGSSSVVYISSSTVIINDNIIQLNAYVPYERYAGFEVFDSGSSQKSASLLWDGQTENWITVDQNSSASNIIIGPTASFGNAIPNLTFNRLPKAYESNAITDSALSDDGITLRYTGNVISASSITASYGTVTYITGALVTYITGSFTTITIATGSNPGAGAVPAHPTASGMAGQINVDNNFVYVYTNNIWKRVPLSTWSL